MRPGLTVRVRRECGCAVITVTGEVDIATAAQLRERISGLIGSDAPLVADLNQVSFIDAAGLGVLVGVARRCAALGSSLHVACAQPQTRRLFRLTRLDSYLRLAHTVTEALQSAAPDEALTADIPTVRWRASLLDLTWRGSRPGRHADFAGP